MATKAEVIAAVNDVILEAVSRIQKEFDETAVGLKSATRVKTYTELAVHMASVAETVDTQDDCEE